MLSKPTDPARWLIDILTNIHAAHLFTVGFTYESFRTNRLVFYGVTRCLEIISEASRRLPQDLKDRHPSIPWAAIAGAGNFYRHEYGGVDSELIWGTLQERLPELLGVVEQELEALGVEPPDDKDRPA
jgi:uncharacterized protein with HEPN domain